jgi:hypothetical protein
MYYFILFYVSFVSMYLCVYMCTNHCHRVFTQLQMTKISIVISAIGRLLKKDMDEAVKV